MKEKLFKNLKEAAIRRRELSSKIQELTVLIGNAENDYASALARGKPGEEIASQILKYKTEQQGITAAFQLVEAEMQSLHRAEKIEQKKSLSKNLMDQFEAEILPQIRAAVQQYADWRQSSELSMLQGNGSSPDPTGGAFDGQGGYAAPTKVIAAMVAALLRHKQEYVPVSPMTPGEVAGLPENRVKFGKNAKVSSGRRPITRTDNSTDAGCLASEI